MADNRHLHRQSRLPTCIMGGELKILETNLKSEVILTLYLIFLQILMRL